MTTVSILFLTSIISLILSVILSSKYSPLKIHDLPNERSLHIKPIPRTGGIAILSSISLGLIAFHSLGYWDVYLTWIIYAALLLVVISILDDFVSLHPLPRLLAHGFSALIIIYGFELFSSGGLIIILCWFFLVWVMNLYNFMDGMDGLAAGMAVIGFSMLGLAGWFNGNIDYAFFAWIISFACLGFLITNYPPAKLFMGDVGSIPLGMLVAAFSIWGINNKIFPIWFPILIFSPFFVDATLTLLRRLVQGKKLWHAHRTHYYQRLALADGGHRRTLIAEYLLMVACGVTSLISLQLAPFLQWMVMIVWGVIYLVLIVSIEKLLVKRARNTARD